MPPRSYRRQAVLIAVFAGVFGPLLAGCQSSKVPSAPSIQFSRVPPSGEGSSDTVDTIEGRVTGAPPGTRIVLFARSGDWWVQPLETQPFTAIRPDSTWENVSHPGTAYAALLVDSRYRPPLTVNALPEKGGPVLAVATAEGRLPPSALKTLQFSGYDWEIRESADDAGGTKNFYDPANAWTDPRGFLHLSIVKRGERWLSAEVSLTRSLGYGRYRFIVLDVAHLEPAAVFALFTWDNSGPPREMDIEVSRWGEPADKNAQYVIQPYVVPANTVRFEAPAGMLTYWIDWQPGRVAFQTTRSASSNMGQNLVSEHVFTSGIPSPGNERIHMILYVYGNRNNPLQHGCEVIVENFEFLP